MTSRAYRPSYQNRFDELSTKISEFEMNVNPLPGIVGIDERATLINQLIDSERRNAHFERLLSRAYSADVADPHCTLFDPLKAAIHHQRIGNFDEACWLVFLFVHFGKHPVSGWRFVREVYGRLGNSPIWSWDEISANTPEFRLWLGESQAQLLRRDERRGFGNHRKYSSLSHESERGTAAVFESYVDWVMEHGGHNGLFDAYSRLTAPEIFDELYRSMDRVIDFGRIAKFDYLMTLSRLRILDIHPAHTYLKSATGPLRGARLLLGGPGSTMSVRDLDPLLIQFSSIVGVTPDVLEDAICNWQKSPAKFHKFVI